MENIPSTFSMTLGVLIAFSVTTLIIIPLLFIIKDESINTKAWIVDKHHQSFSQRALHYCQLVNIATGSFMMWIALFMVLIQFTVVIMRYVFSIGSIPMQESIWYMHGTLFMMGLGYTFLKDGHVRLDIFYREASEKTKALVNLLGSVFFLAPVCIFTLNFSWSFVLNSWKIKEGSIEVSGIPYLYLFKTVIIVAIVLLLIQAIACIIQSSIYLLNAKNQTQANDR